MYQYTAVVQTERNACWVNYVSAGKCTYVVNILHMSCTVCTKKRIFYLCFFFNIMLSQNPVKGLSQMSNVHVKKSVQCNKCFGLIYCLSATVLLLRLHFKFCIAGVCSTRSPLMHYCIVKSSLWGFFVVIATEVSQ